MSKQDVVNEYLEAKRKFEEAEANLKKLRVEVEPLVAAAGGTLIQDNVVLKLIDMERENFNLKAAKEKLDMRQLNPFISISEYKQLRIQVKL